LNSFIFIELKTAGHRVDTVAQRCQAAHPFTFATCVCHLVTGSLGDDLTFKLGEGQEDVEHQPAHRISRIELLGHAHKSHALAFEYLQHLGKVQQRSTEAIYFVDHDAIDLACLDVCQKSLQGCPIHIATCETTVVVAIRQADPALILLAFDVSLG